MLEESHLYIRRRENLMSNIVFVFIVWMQGSTVQPLLHELTDNAVILMRLKYRGGFVNKLMHIQILRMTGNLLDS
jgi:hypothetical protein